MKTKAQIVQQLLEDKKITAEEAVILLTADIHYYPISAPAPYYPSWPYYPAPTWIVNHEPQTAFLN